MLPKFTRQKKHLLQKKKPTNLKTENRKQVCNINDNDNLRISAAWIVGSIAPIRAAVVRIRS